MPLGAPFFSMSSCLRCQRTLDAEGACPERHGLFLDRARLERELPFAALAAVQEAAERGTPTTDACPACGAAMARVLVRRGADDVELDACPSCGAHWFDAGELERVKAAQTSGARASAPVPAGARALRGVGEGALVAVADPAVGAWIFDMLGALLGGFFDQ